MRPSDWGPYLWHSIHLISLGYPQTPSAEERTAYREFLTRLRHVIPCRKCSVNYARHLEELPLNDAALASRDSLFAWTVELHNLVNAEHNKPTWTVQRAHEYYAAIGDKALHNTPMQTGKRSGTVGSSDPVIPAVPRSAVYVLVSINAIAILLVLVLMGIMLRQRFKSR